MTTKNYYQNKEQEEELKEVLSKFRNYYKLDISESMLINFMINFANICLGEISATEQKQAMLDYIEECKKDNLSSVVDEYFTV
jgi:hypothetical protein